MRTHTVQAFLEAGIESLMPQAQRLIELRKVLAGALPPNLRRSCTIANFMQGKVVIFADNSAIAAKLRLLEPDLRAHLLNRSIQVTGITIRVQPKQPAPPLPGPAPRSAAAAESLRTLASQLSDSPLKNAIAALATQIDEKT